MLVDELHAGVAIGRTAMDAPEVDPLVVITDGEAADLFLERLATANAGGTVGTTQGAPIWEIDLDGEVAYAARADDMLIIRGVNVFPSQIEELILKDDRFAPHYQLEVHKEGPLDKLTVNVESRKPVDDGAAAAMSKDLTHHIKSLIGISAAVTIKPEGAVERSMGKAKRVIDNR